MSYPTDAVAIPPAIAAQLPPRDLLREVLASYIVEIPAGCELVRAAWNTPSIWPHAVMRTYRFGPPDSMKTGAGFPFFWIYTAETAYTAVWEAQFCKNPATHPGRFVIEAGAENGLIANLSFSQPLQLFDLSGVAASRLGIYDHLRSPDYIWCQWLGFELDQILAELGGQVHGFIYPSRRHPGARAYAISSHVQSVLARVMATKVQQFSEARIFAELLADPCHIARNLL